MGLPKAGKGGTSTILYVNITHPPKLYIVFENVAISPCLPEGSGFSHKLCQLLAASSPPPPAPQPFVLRDEIIPFGGDYS